MSKLSNIPSTAEAVVFIPCTACGRTKSENTKELFLIKHEHLLKEIEKSKEELAEHLQQLENLEGDQEIKGGNSNEVVQNIFNIENLGMLQDLLEQAEESEEVLLFTDQKKNTWQIISRNDINVGDGLNDRIESEAFKTMQEEESKGAQMIKSKNLVINVDAIEQEHQYSNGSPEGEKRVSILESGAKSNAEAAKN